MAVFAVPQQIDVDVLVPPLAVRQRDAHDLNHGFRLVRIHVEYERLGHLANIRAINRTPSVQVIRREAHLVVDHDVDGSARAVAVKLGHLRHLVDNALARNGRIPVNEDRQDRRFFAAQGIDACPRQPFHHRPDRLEVRRVGCEGDGHFLTGIGLQGARVAEVVLDVTIEFALFVVRLPFEFAENLLVGLTENVRKCRQTTAVGHTDEHFLHPMLGALFHHGIQCRNQGLTALEGKALLANKLFLEKLFKQGRLSEFFQNLNPVFYADARAVGELDVLAHPGLALHVLNGHVLDANGVAIGQLQVIDNLLQRRRSDAHLRSRLKDRIKVRR